MKRIIKITVVAFAIMSLASCIIQHQQTDPVSKDQTYRAIPLSGNYENQIDSTLIELTLEEKVGMLHGNSKFTTAGVERLGIPELTMIDGPLGIREEISRETWEPRGWTNDFATFYPAGGAIAAT